MVSDWMYTRNRSASAGLYIGPVSAHEYERTGLHAPKIAWSWIFTVLSLEDLEHSKGNILFFGDFATLTPDELTHGMMDLIGDQPVVYETMIHNLYGLGSVLRKKFMLLQAAYTSFMIALVLGVTSFIAVFVWIQKFSPI